MNESNTELTDLREHLKRFRDVTFQTLEFTPDDRLIWSPGEGLRSFADQFLHIAQVEDFYSHGFFAGDYDFDRLKSPAEPLTRDGLRERLIDAHAFTDENLASLDAARLDEVMQVPNVPVPWSLRSWLWYLVEHEVHHKAQLALYQRQAGVTPPFFAFVFPRGVRPDIR
ncbi:MAG TPA: DinB family protein [Blastocatellia bacterium]|nr:DinB family protein [Blastocatellia bacterium]